MAGRFEFDPVNRLLLFRCEGRLTDESLAESYQAIRKHSTATDAMTGILDFSSVTELAVSSEFIRQLANQEPAMADATRRPRIIVAPDTVGVWSISHVSAHGGVYTAAIECRTHHGRGAGGTQHPIPKLPTFRVTARVPCLTRPAKRQRVVPARDHDPFCDALICCSR